MHNLRVKTVFLPYDDFDVSILEQNIDHFESISIWRCRIEDDAWQLLCVSMSKVLCNKVINVDAVSLPENCGLIWRLMQRFHNLERLQIMLTIAQHQKKQKRSSLATRTFVLYGSIADRWTFRLLPMC